MVDELGGGPSYWFTEGYSFAHYCTENWPQIEKADDLNNDELADFARGLLAGTEANAAAAAP